MSEEEPQKRKLIVSDAGPLISMLKIGRLDLLKEIFEEVILPQAVSKRQKFINEEF